ncbi:hypothetical protein DPMN_021847 [Dreissena polymorpha]|uniref:Uncharacterized protein n=1 Tax=Dreissena polymorpha TaxID=45954 RepID=A0A9D4NPK0_DREPO|nr:hypothetical protein DPMN_021847 [Dreissena polymorpha]
MTLRDRVLGRVDPNCQTTGSPALFDHTQEQKLVDHIKRMADYCYGYTRQECCDIATDFAIELGIRQKRPSGLDDLQSENHLQSWTTFRVGRPSELYDLQSLTTFRVGPPSELDDLQMWTTFRGGPPSDLDRLQSYTTFRVRRPSDLEDLKSRTTFRV